MPAIPGPGQWRDDAADEWAVGQTSDRPAAVQKVLELFGWDYFARARDAVDAQRRTLQSTAQGTGPAGQGSAPPAEALTQAVGPEVMQQRNVGVTVPERYQLGPGDVVTLRYWTPTDNPTEVSLRVDERGTIVLPMGGRIVARGQTLAQLEANLHKELSRKIRDVSVVLTLKELRTIPVVITGEAYSPGSYQVPAVATLFNVLYACGGPKEGGSLRNIQLRRAGGQSRRFDFYDFVLRGDTRNDVPLQPGDVVYIPLTGPRVSVRGEIFRPAIFELAQGERLRDAIRYAGNAKPSGVAQRVSIESVQPGITRKMVDVNLLDASAANNPTLFDGDLVEILSIRPAFNNLVTVSGAVDQPGRYALAPGMTVLDLVERARGPLNDAYLARADLFRLNPDGTQRLIQVDLAQALQRVPKANVPLERMDKLLIYGVRDVQWMGYRRVYIAGAVQRPSGYERADGMRVKDLLLQAGGPRPDAVLESAFLQRRDADGTFGPMLRVDLGKAVVDDPQHNIELADRDTLTVLNIREANFIPQQSVEVAGAVQRPGRYVRALGMRAGDLVQLAGNPMPDASLERAFLQRRNLDGTLGPLVTLDLRRTLANDQASNPVLQDRDQLTVYTLKEAAFTPKQVVEVTGAVQKPQEYPRGESMRAADLVGLAGGLLPDAFPERAFLQRRNLDGTLGPLVTLDLRRTLANDPASNPLLQDRDQLTVYTMKQAVFAPEQVVQIDGAVQKPEKYPRGDGMRVSDLVSLAGGVIPEAFAERAFLQRQNPDRTVGPLLPIDLGQALAQDPKHDLVLQDHDTLTVYTKEQARFSPEQVVEILGAVQKPASYKRAEGMRLKDLLQLAGGPKPEHYDEMEVAHARQPAGAPVAKVSIAAALRGDPQANVEIADGDVVTVHARQDFMMKPYTVAIAGQVKYPGTYALTGDERLSDVLKRAGGATERAFLAGTQFSRRPDLLSTKQQADLTKQVQEVLQVVAREEYARSAAKADLEKLRIVATTAGNGASAAPTASLDVTKVLQPSGETTQPQPVSEAQAAAVLQHSAVSPARRLTDTDLQPVGNLRVDVVKALKAPGGREDLALKDGDIVTVPERPVTVSVVGAVTLPSSVPFEPGRAVGWYIGNSGGYMADAARDRVLLIRSTGQVAAVKSGTKVQAGDIIMVPTKVMAIKLRDAQSTLDNAIKYATNGLLTYAVIRAITK